MMPRHPYGPCVDLTICQRRGPVVRWQVKLGRAIEDVTHTPDEAEQLALVLLERVREARRMIEGADESLGAKWAHALARATQDERDQVRAEFAAMLGARDGETAEEAAERCRAAEERSR